MKHFEKTGKQSVYKSFSARKTQTGIALFFGSEKCALALGNGIKTDLI